MSEDNKICDNCLDCNTCDLDPSKECNNCAKCIDTGAAFRAIEIDEIVAAKELKKKLKLIRKNQHDKKE